MRKAIEPRTRGGVVAARIELNRGLLRREMLSGNMRYFMHIADKNGFVEDQEGRELPDDAAARTEAIAAARDVMANDLRLGQLDLTSFIEVEDETHQLLFTITFADAVTLTTDMDPTRQPPAD